MPHFFAHADAMLLSLHPGAIFARTIPYKLQCYMACGKPIVVSGNGEAARLVQESDAGFTAEAGSPEGLAEAVTKMLALSAGERAGLGLRSRACFDAHFSRDRVYGDLDAWLREAVSARRSRRGR